MKILCVFTCYNRKEKTEKCIKDLVMLNPSLGFTFVIVDDNSNDGTYENLIKLRKKYSLFIIRGNGSLFYCGGMRLGMQYAIRKFESFDYLLLVNDDVDFFPNSIEKIVKQSKEQNGAVIIGALKDNNGELSYSAVKYITGFKDRRMDIDEWQEDADTFNANCVLVPYQCFVAAGPMDGNYTHYFCDFDYGFELKRKGYKLHVSKEYCGICDRNNVAGTWLDNSLSISKRIKLKESPKGSPAKECFYFCYKNFGLINAIVSTLRPYFKILLKR
ncbi:glycosyltransferase family 2 protein [uncultured Anaerovibrio sp.]|uniref:glycosyltransferase family 2 protein n=1 Tax=uncultured Anaerovibrio sp. TaxID=361586 RepID=UPI0026230FDF|nr:glycosyltransferase [uncultured Anaerovibrio sp.]